MAVLAIGAHPDDIEFGCYATLLKFKDVHILVMSAGELSGNPGKRVEEALKSAGMIGANVEIWGYPDTSIPLDGNILARLRKHVDEIKPSIIFAPYGHDTHQDHRHVAQLAEAACNNVEKLLQYELPSTKTDFVPNVFYDVTTEFISKVEALECHESQMSKPYFNKRVIENIARFRAFQCKRYGMLCEAFYGNKIIEET